MSYISVLEFHKSGRPHLHVLVDRYLPQRWISKSWEALGGGRIVHIERVADPGRVGLYLSKYLTKSAILSAPWGTRRYTTSRDIRLFEKRESSGWWVTNHSLEWLHGRAGSDLLEEEFDFEGSITFFVASKNIEN